MEIKVEKKFIRTSPDKIRLIINYVRNKNANDAIGELKFIGKSAATPVIEIIKSGISAAKDKDLELEELKISQILCNEGPKLKRRRIIHKGRATAINKRSSHLILILSDNKSDKKKTVNKINSNIKDIKKPAKETVKGDK